MANVLVIDDERAIRRSLREILEYEKFEVKEAEDAKQALTLIESNKFDLILCDVKMPGMDGMELLDQLMDKSVDIPFIMISGHGSIDNAVEAIKKGAYDFIEKPLDLNRLLVSIRNGLDRTELVKETKELKRKIQKKSSTEIIGDSSAIATVKQMIEKVAPSDSRVLILGQNGTGKELVARSLHEKSSRANGPFVEVNCAAIPSELIESELFGHEKGSFTSAIRQKKGKFELADGGTLFLDEVGDMSLDAQAKVLRALQENTISRVGGDKSIKVNVRLIAATNKDLKGAISEKLFREDLYHRLAVIVIDVPALDERKDDIPLLVEHFNELIAKEQNIALKKFEPKAIEALKKLSWTGNVRELANVVERLIILCDKNVTEKDISKYVVPS